MHSRRTQILGLWLLAAAGCGSARRECVGLACAPTLPAGAEAIGYHTAEGQPTDEPVSLTADGLTVTAAIHAPSTVSLERCRLQLTVTEPSGASTSLAAGTGEVTRSATQVEATFRVAVDGFGGASALRVERALECEAGLRISVPPVEVFVASPEARRACGPEVEAEPEIMWQTDIVNTLWLELPPGRLARVSAGAIVDDCTGETLLDRSMLPTARTFRGPSRIELDERIFAALAGRSPEPLRLRIDLEPTPRAALEPALRAARFARIEAGHLEPAIDL